MTEPGSDAMVVVAVAVRSIAAAGTAGVVDIREKNKGSNATVAAVVGSVAVVGKAVVGDIREFLAILTLS